jgi:hypothetical protein
MNKVSIDTFLYWKSRLQECYTGVLWCDDEIHNQFTDSYLELTDEDVECLRDLTWGNELKECFPSRNETLYQNKGEVK